MRESTEVKQAAERLRRNAYPLDGVFFEEHGCTQMEADCELLARAWLSEQTADDSEPITEEWLCGLFDVYPGRGVILDEKLSLFNSRKGWRLVVGRNGADDSDDSFTIAFIKTRCALRRLCSALGITLKEPRHA